MVLMGAPMSSKPPKLIEGVDYYLEGGRYVFTELFHLKRGYCCNSGCRHCPYRGDEQASRERRRRVPVVLGAAPPPPEPPAEGQGGDGGGEAAADVVRVTLPKLPQLR